MDPTSAGAFTATPFIVGVQAGGMVWGRVTCVLVSLAWSIGSTFLAWGYLTGLLATGVPVSLGLVLF
jgi:hypothetical protein